MGGYADIRGLPLIAMLIMANGAQAAWHLSHLAAKFELQRVKAVADANLEQAEDKFVACIKSEPIVIGTAIYVPVTRRSALDTKQVPEIGG